MERYNILRKNIEEMGFDYVHEVYAEEEIERMLSVITSVDSTSQVFRRTTDLFAIRQCLKEIPELTGLVLNQKLKNVIFKVFGSDYFVVKSIYFDKPGTSNWFVSYHQDLTISVDNKKEIEGFGPWTVKQDKYAVQPPKYILDNIFTVRIHLDETNEKNGALHVIPASHLKDIRRYNEMNKEAEVICHVPKGGIMIMKPLLWHSSKRSSENKTRRVIHIEFSNKELPSGISWSEKQAIE